MVSSPSPFHPSIPHLQLAWDSTSISLLQECPYKYYLSMILQFHARGTSIHLDFGGQYASVQELYRKERMKGIEHDEAVYNGTRFCLSWDDSPYIEDTKNFPYKNRHTLARTFVWHAEQYRHDAFHILQLDDGSAAAELSFRLELDIEAPGHLPFLLCGHLDAFGEFQGDYYFLDDKTTKSALTDTYFQGFTPNTQMTNYFVATKYVEAFKAVATSPNQKIFMMPVEATGVLSSLAGIAEIAKSAGAAQAAAEAAKRPPQKPAG